MKVLIIGAGAIGIAMGASLKASGFDVDFLASGETKKAIDAGGIKRTGLFGDISWPAGSVGAYDCYNDILESYDYVIVSAKTHANADIAASLGAHARILGASGVIVIMQNGWGNDAEYLKYFPKERIYSARVITGFERTRRNISNITVHTAPILIGSLYGLSKEPAAPLAKAIRMAGIPSEPSDAIPEALWAKMLYNCSLNPLGAILGVNYGNLTEQPYTIMIMDHLIDEIFAVMQASGFRTFWNTPDEYRETFYGKLVPDTYHHQSSTLQDIKKRQKTEIDTLTGRILELGKKAGIPTPFNEMLYNMIKAIEAAF